MCPAHRTSRSHVVRTAIADQRQHRRHEHRPQKLLPKGRGPAPPKYAANTIDYHTIAEELVHQGTYEQAGGLLYLSELNLATPSAAHIEHYARIVLEHAVRRRYISAAQQVAELAWNRRKDLDTVKQRAEALVLGASSDTLSPRAVLSPSEWTEHLMDYLGQARAGGLAGVSTGLRDLDTMTLGLSPGLYLLAASTGTGKTALARPDSIARRRAPRSGGVREHGAV